MFDLSISTSGAAFADDETGDITAESVRPELARILRDMANRLEIFLPVAEKGIPVLDINGNTVGRWSWEA